MAERELDQTWKDHNIFDLWTFRDLLSNQMIKYNPTHHKYVGGTNMRPAKYQNQAARYKINYYARGKGSRPLVEEVQLSNFEKKKK